MDYLFVKEINGNTFHFSKPVFLKDGYSVFTLYKLDNDRESFKKPFKFTMKKSENTKWKIEEIDLPQFILNNESELSNAVIAYEHTQGSNS